MRLLHAALVPGRAGRVERGEAVTFRVAEDARQHLRVREAGEGGRTVEAAGPRRSARRPGGIRRRPRPARRPTADTARAVRGFDRRPPGRSGGPPGRARPTRNPRLASACPPGAPPRRTGARALAACPPEFVVAPPVTRQDLEREVEMVERHVGGADGLGRGCRLEGAAQDARRVVRREPVKGGLGG